MGVKNRFNVFYTLLYECKLKIIQMKKELTEEQKKWVDYLNQFIKESGRGPKGFFVELKTGEYLDYEGYNKWIVEMKENFAKNHNF